MADSIYRSRSDEHGTVIAVGANGLILRSTDDGVTWVQVDAGIGNHFYGVAYGEPLGNPQWVIVGQNGVILTSPTGEAWTVRVSFTSSDLYDVAFGGVFLAVGVGGELGTSGDLGITWEQHPSGTTENLHSVVIDAGGYIIVGANDTVITGTLASLDLDILVEDTIWLSETIAGVGEYNAAVTDSLEFPDSGGSRLAGQYTEFVISGAVVAGNTYTITLDGTPYTYTVPGGGGTISDVVNGLIALIDPSVKFEAKLSGTDTVVVMSQSPPTPFTFSSSSVGGTISAGTTTLASACQVITATVSGTVTPGHTYTVTLDGVDYSYTAIGGDTLDLVAVGLAADIDGATYSATASGAVVTITKLSPEATFTYTTSDPGIALALVQTFDGSGMVYYEYITDYFLTAEPAVEALGSYNVGVVDTVTFLDASDVQHINWGDVALSLPQIRVSATLLTGNVWSGSIRMPGMQVSGQMTTPWTASITLPALEVSGEFAEQFLFSAAIVLPLLQVSGAFATTQLSSDYAVWVVNRVTKAHSTYTNWDVNSHGDFNGTEIVATADGLYTLTGTTDGASQITAKVYWPPSNFGSDKQQRVDTVYVRLRGSDTPIKIVATTDEVERRIYTGSMTGFPDGIHPKRILFTRHLYGNMWQIGFENTQGGGFALAEVEVITVPSANRRLK